MKERDFTTEHTEITEEGKRVLSCGVSRLGELGVLGGKKIPKLRSNL